MATWEAMEPEWLSTFIRKHCHVARLPFLPELRLYLANEVFELWKESSVLLTADPPMPFWAFAWSGGQALGRYILDQPETVRGRTLLDVGSGSGLVAISALKAGASAVAISETDALARAAIRMNALENEVNAPHEQEDIRLTEVRGYDVVCAGDTLYDTSITEVMLPALKGAASARSLVLVGDPDRGHLPAPGLKRLAAYDIPVMEAVEDGPTRKTTVWQMSVPKADKGPRVRLGTLDIWKTADDHKDRKSRATGRRERMPAI